MIELSYLKDYEHEFNNIVPGAKFTEGPGYVVRAVWSISVSSDYARLPNENRARQEARVLAEQMRARIIRKLGVQTILDGYAREANYYQIEAKRLQRVTESQAGRIAYLEEELRLANEDNYGPSDT